MLRITFLGTGTSQGVPMIGCGCEVCMSDDKRDKRLRSAVMIERFSKDGASAEKYGGAFANPDFGVYTSSVGADARIVIDAGPDFRYQMLREKVRTIDAILLTHEHRDHTAGIDDVRAFNYFEGRAIPIYATEQVGCAIRKDYDYAFGSDKYPGAPEIELHTINPEQPFDTAGFHVIPITGTHYRIPVTGYRIGSLAYLTDFNSIEPHELAKLQGVEVLVINALRYVKHISHFTVDEALDIASKVGARRTYITHMSHQIGLHKDICGTLPEGVEFATDGMKVDINEPQEVKRLLELK